MGEKKDHFLPRMTPSDNWSIAVEAAEKAMPSKSFLSLTPESKQY